MSNEIVYFVLIIVSGSLSSLEIRPLILEEIKEAQRKDEVLVKARKEAERQTLTEFKVCANDTLLFKGRTCVLDILVLKE